MSIFASKILVIGWLGTLTLGFIFAYTGNTTNNIDDIYRSGLFFGTSSGILIGMIICKYEIRRILKSKYGIDNP